MHPPTWRDLAGRVDLVLVAAAWPDFHERARRWPLPLRPVIGPLTRSFGGRRTRSLYRRPGICGFPLLLPTPWVPCAMANPSPEAPPSSIPRAPAWPGLPGGRISWTPSWKSVRMVVGLPGFLRGGVFFPGSTGVLPAFRQVVSHAPCQGHAHHPPFQQHEGRAGQHEAQALFPGAGRPGDPAPRCQDRP